MLSCVGVAGDVVSYGRGSVRAQLDWPCTEAVNGVAVLNGMLQVEQSNSALLREAPPELDLGNASSNRDTTLATTPMVDVSVFPEHLAAMTQMITRHGEEQIIPEDVNVLLVDFDLNATLSAPLFDVLSEDERYRALRFARHADAVRFATTRAALRYCLSATVGRAATAVQLSYSSFGRPLLSKSHMTTIDFNVSHSGNHALIVWSAKRRVGVDIEHRRPEWEWQPLKSRVCGDIDKLHLHASPLALQRAFFFDIWVAKEAFLKAYGVGISVKLTDFSVASHNSALPLVQGCEVRALILNNFQACWMRNIDDYAVCVAWSSLQGVLEGMPT